MTPVVDPTLSLERRLFRSGYPLVIGCDEVGRGAIAGPVAVGMSVLDRSRRIIPEGLRDSKMLSEPRREELAPIVRDWVLHASVGLASAEEVDTHGIIVALGLAASRAYSALLDDGVDTSGAIVVLDGNHDYLSPAITGTAAVMTRIKADQDCASVSAASVIAKVHRDRLMIRAHEDAAVYSWNANKGYASSAHYAAIDEHGPHALHRVSWLRTPALMQF
ncbi:ribonuclease HII [Rathayibacter sp. YIM 133350]|uniref:ribonuclease HII n=1 Tax=Rathayibacter sp. YIM 133350 TaxID=3131992 RepID=UPI00307FCB49